MPAGLLSNKCHPFDLWRTTGVIGEGACYLVLEPESSPRPGICWLEGYSYSTDTEGGVARGLRLAAKMAIYNARLIPEKIDHLSCWGPGHRTIDKAEAEAVQDIFGSQTSELSAYSIKGAIGNPLGAAGAIQVACVSIAMTRGFLPPTVNWEYPDPVCALNLSKEVRRVSTNVALINSHGLNGTNSAMVLQKC